MRTIAFLFALSLAPLAASAASVTARSLVDAFPTRKEALLAIGPAGPEKVAEALEQFRVEGWAILPAGAAIGPAAQAELQALAVRAFEPGSRDRIADTRVPLDPRSSPLYRDYSPGNPALKEAMASLKVLVQLALRGEQARFMDGPSLESMRGASYERGPHADYGGYWNSVYALNHSGTVIYPVEKGRVREVAAPVHSVVLLSADDRYRATGIQPPVHASPAGRISRRDILKVGGDDEEFDAGARFLAPIERIPEVEAEVGRVERWLKSRSSRKP